jgi:hypothetical protein
LSSREETVPLWAVRDVDFIQTLTQKARGVADLRLQIDPAAGVSGERVVVLKSVHDGKAVRDLILRQANIVRNYRNQRRHELDVERQRAGASQIFTPAPELGPPASSGGSDDLMAQLTKLGEMKQASCSPTRSSPPQKPSCSVLPDRPEWHVSADSRPSGGIHPHPPG